MFFSFISLVLHCGSLFIPPSSTPLFPPHCSTHVRDNRALNFHFPGLSCPSLARKLPVLLHITSRKSPIPKCRSVGPQCTLSLPRLAQVSLPFSSLISNPTKWAWCELHGKAADVGPDTTSRVHSQSATDTAECGTQPVSDSGNSAGSGRRNSCQFLFFLRTASTDHTPVSHPMHLGSREQHDQ